MAAPCEFNRPSFISAAGVASFEAWQYRPARSVIKPSAWPLRDKSEELAKRCTINPGWNNHRPREDLQSWDAFGRWMGWVDTDLHSVHLPYWINCWQSNYYRLINCDIVDSDVWDEETIRIVSEPLQRWLLQSTGCQYREKREELQSRQWLLIALISFLLPFPWIQTRMFVLWWLIATIWPCNKIVSYLRVCV